MVFKAQLFSYDFGQVTSLNLRFIICKKRDDEDDGDVVDDDNITSQGS